MTWLLDFIPWWVWLIGGVAVIGATYTFWSPFWLLIPRPVKLALGAIAGIAAAYLAGRNRGVANEKQRQKEADARAVKRRLDTNEEVNRLPAAERDKRLDGWMRD